MSESGSVAAAREQNENVAGRDEVVLVLDFGSQTAQLIARRVREQNVFCQLVRHDLTAERIRQIAPKGLILSGGPASVYADGAPQPDPAIFELGIPILGICYGMQLICLAEGSEVSPGLSREFGNTTCRVVQDDPLLAGLPESSTVWMSHGDQVKGLTEHFVTLAATDSCPNTAIRHQSKPIYGLQFHPEVTHTEHGSELIGNFVSGVCGCDGHWRISSFIEEQTAAIRDRVGESRVICGLSGGVDSSVTAALLFKAIGSQLSCIFVDNGLLRKGEREQVGKSSAATFRRTCTWSTLAGTSSTRSPALPTLRPNASPSVGCSSRRSRGRQSRSKTPTSSRTGTLYPDVIESGGHPDGPADSIKYHHNVGGLPEDLGFELIEPLRDLFKDEVRQMGLELGLPEDLVWRHPFPGPGLAVRCLGEVTEERLETLREADAILIEELRAADLYLKVQQAFAVLLPLQTVGVMGDARTYEDVIAIRSVDTDNFMTADWSRLPYDLLQRVSTRIINNVRGVNRVCFDVSSKPPATIEWE